MTLTRHWVLALLVLGPALAVFFWATMKKDRETLERFGDPGLLRMGAPGAGPLELAMGAAALIALFLALLAGFLTGGGDQAEKSYGVIHLVALASIPLAYLLYARLGESRKGSASRESIERPAGQPLMARTAKLTLTLAAVVLMVLALAGPRWGASREKITRQGVDVVVVIDSSLSMLARDVAPTRLAKAKQAVEKLLDLMQGDRVGLVVFSGYAEPVCPLTLDYSAARMFLELIEPGYIPEPGTNVSEALETAAAVFDGAEKDQKVIILISDGEHLDDTGKDPATVARELAEGNIKVFTIGVGAPGKDASIPLRTNEGTIDKTDYKGDVVLTRIDEVSLKKIALETSAEYRRLDNSSSGSELADIYAKVADLDETVFEEQYQITYELRYQWLIALAIALLAIEMVLPDTWARRKKR